MLSNKVEKRGEYVFTFHSFAHYVFCMHFCVGSMCLHFIHLHIMYFLCIFYFCNSDKMQASQQAIGYQKEIKKTLGKTSETDAYLKFEMTSYVKCQTDL